MSLARVSSLAHAIVVDATTAKQTAESLITQRQLKRIIEMGHEIEEATANVIRHLVAATKEPA